MATVDEWLVPLGFLVGRLRTRLRVRSEIGRPQSYSRPKYERISWLCGAFRGERLCRTSSVASGFREACGCVKQTTCTRSFAAEDNERFRRLFTGLRTVVAYERFILGTFGCVINCVRYWELAP